MVAFNRMKGGETDPLTAYKHYRKLVRKLKHPNAKFTPKTDLRKVDYGSQPAFDEWWKHFPLSTLDLIGIKTYQSNLPYNLQPSYFYWPGAKHPSILELV
jgi:hypothetical protein